MFFLLLAVYLLKQHYVEIAILTRLGSEVVVLSLDAVLEAELTWYL